MGFGASRAISGVKRRDLGKEEKQASRFSSERGLKVRNNKQAMLQLRK